MGSTSSHQAAASPTNGWSVSYAPKRNEPTGTGHRADLSFTNVRGVTTASIDQLQYVTPNSSKLSETLSMRAKLSLGHIPQTLQMFIAMCFSIMIVGVVMFCKRRRRNVNKDLEPIPPAIGTRPRPNCNEAPLLQQKSTVIAADIIPRAKQVWLERDQPQYAKPVYVLKVRFVGRQDIPCDLFESLMARIQKLKRAMLDDCDIPPDSESRDWSLCPNYLTDGSWFVLFKEQAKSTDEPEIVLRINRRGDGALRRVSCCFARRVWYELRALIEDSCRDVSVQTLIVLEDWECEIESQQQDLEHRLDEISLDDNGFVQDPSLFIPVVSSSDADDTPVLQLWPQPLDRSSLPVLAPDGQNLDFKNLKRSTILGASRCFVYKGLYDGYPVAAKQFDLKHDQGHKFESDTHPALKCRTLLHAFGFCESDDGLHGYLILEYAKYGSLHKVCHSKPVTKYEKSDEGLDISLPMRVRWLQDVITAVFFLHQSRMMHRDIKCENVMLHSDMTALLGDLGWAKEMSKSYTISGNAGTSCFRAPEVSGDREVKYSKPADIYSYGMTMVELLTGECPTRGCAQLEELILCSSDCNCEYTFHLNVLCYIAKLSTMQDPRKRPTAEAVNQWCDILLRTLDRGRKRISGRYELLDRTSEVGARDDEEPLQAVQRELERLLSDREQARGEPMSEALSRSIG